MIEVLILIFSIIGALGFAYDIFSKAINYYNKRQRFIRSYHKLYREAIRHHMKEIVLDTNSVKKKYTKLLKIGVYMDCNGDKGFDCENRKFKLVLSIFTKIKDKN